MSRKAIDFIPEVNKVMGGVPVDATSRIRVITKDDEVLTSQCRYRPPHSGSQREATSQKVLAPRFGITLSGSHMLPSRNSAGFCDIRVSISLSNQESDNYSLRN